MIRVQIVVEGSTEEAVLKALLVAPLAERGVFLSPMRVLRGGGARGGGSSWQPWEKHLLHLLKQDASPDVRVGTFLDLYRVPKDVPGFDATKLGGARADGILAAMRTRVSDDRFLPYLQLHEIEALLFTDLSALTQVEPDVFPTKGVAALAAAVAGVPPEAINDRYETAPSRRLKASFPAFDKVEHGSAAAARIGLAAIRNACPRFDHWVSTLEALSAT
jgi:hypothetical protein